MSELKHTEGPWTLRPLNEEIGEYEIVGPRHNDDTGESEYIAVVCGGLPESEANAHLISAAPDMLAVLRMVDALGMMEFPDGPDDPRTIAEIAPDWLDMWRAARAAIAKATGEND